jgi:D-alanyl-D-alanine carboxypeptidase
VPLPSVTARSWIILDGQTGRMIWVCYNSLTNFQGKNEHSKKEIASLTKIMTAYVTLQMIEKLKIDPKKTYLSVSSFSACIGGTSA